MTVRRPAGARGRIGAAIALGALLAFVTWLVVVPWDLSEIDADGRPRAGGGDDSALLIAWVLVIVVAVAIAIVLRPDLRPLAAHFTAGGALMWMGLFAWRAAASRTSGANLFLVPLLFIVLPAVVIAPFVVRSVARRLDRRAARR